jgi:hypothetical protein
MLKSWSRRTQPSGIENSDRLKKGMCHIAYWPQQGRAVLNLRDPGRWLLAFSLSLYMRSNASIGWVRQFFKSAKVDCLLQVRHWGIMSK